MDKCKKRKNKTDLNEELYKEQVNRGVLNIHKQRVYISPK